MTMRRISLYPSNRFLTRNPLAAFNLAPSDLASFEGPLGKFFDSMLSDTAGDGQNDEEVTFTPGVSVTETKDQVKVSSEVSGVKLEDIEISKDKDLLTITGEKKKGYDEKNETLTYSSRQYGKFKHVIRLQAEVQDEIDAVLKDGVLEVTLTKKAPEVTVRKIPIRTH